MMSCNSMGFCGNGCNDSLRHVEQIALNKGAIDCLNGRVCRNEAEIKDRYTKSELDRMLEGKLDKCAFEKYAMKCSCECSDNLQCDCDCYTKAEVDELLSTKVNATLEWHELPLAEGVEYFDRPMYAKFGEIVLLRGIPKWSQDTTLPVTIGQLPEGFRPWGSIIWLSAVRNAPEGQKAYGVITLYIDGRIEYSENTNSDVSTATRGIELNYQFTVAQ